MGSANIAIIGMSAVFPEAKSIEEFWQNLTSGKDSVRPLSKERIESSTLDPDKNYQVFGFLDSVDKFDHAFFNISKGEAAVMDPSQRLLLQLSVEAIENAGYCVEEVSNNNTGVFVGMPSYSSYYHLIEQPDATAGIGNISSMLAGRIAYHLDMHGPAMAIDTACSSSLVAIHSACKSILSNECDMALAGGIKVMTYFPELSDDDNLGIRSGDGKTRSFDAMASGTGGGEGGGMLLLKRLDKALADNDNIHAIILGTAINQDGGRSNGLTAPSPVAQEEVIKKAWKNAAVDPRSITYIETHGTGTKLGDPIEIQALTKAFAGFTSAKKFCALGAVKTNIGHLDNASGIAGVIKVILSLKNRHLFPTVHYNNPNPFIDFENSPVFVNTASRPWQHDLGPRRCGISSFGLSGTNAHAVLQEAPVMEPAELKRDRDCILKVSAKTPAALRNYAARLYGFLRRRQINIQDACFTLNKGRSDHKYRHCITARSREELMGKLASLATGKKTLAEESKKDVIVLFSGSALSDHFRHQLYAQYPAFRRAVDEVNENVSGESLYFKGFVDTYALFSLLKSFGIPVRTIIATGVGKIANQVITQSVPLRDVSTLLNNLNIIPPDQNKLKNVLQTIPDLKDTLFVEIGTGGILLNIISDMNSADCAHNITTFIDTAFDYNPLHKLADLYNMGVPVCWKTFYEGQQHNRIELPAYPFEKIRCWCRETPVTTPIPAKLSYAPPGKEYKIDKDNLSSIESAIIGMWSEVLRKDDIKPTDDFFDMGGHSLNMPQVLSKMEKTFGIRIGPFEMYDNGSADRLAIRMQEIMQQTALSQLVTE